jgi:hypothetical protein
VYTTEDVQTHGNRIFNINRTSNGVFALAIILSGLNTLVYLFNICCKHSIKPSTQSCVTCLSLSQQIISFIIKLALFAMYVALCVFTASIDKDKIQYYIDNQCSEMVLIFSFQQLIDYQYLFFALALGGLFATIVNTGVSTYLILYQIDKVHKIPMEDRLNVDLKIQSRTSMTLGGPGGQVTVGTSNIKQGPNNTTVNTHTATVNPKNQTQVKTT